MAHQGAEGILSFLQDPKNKPLRDLIELAANDDQEALSYVEFIMEEVSKKFKSVDGAEGALQSQHLKIRLDPKDGQEGVRAVDPNLIYYFNEFGLLKNEKKDDNELTFEQYEKVGEELTFYMFYILTTIYKFKPKVVGNIGIAKKKKTKKNDYKFKTILFSPKFEQCDSIVVLIPPGRGCVTYNSLAIDEGLAYGTWLPLIEKILGWNPKFTKKKKKSKKKKNSDVDKIKKEKDKGNNNTKNNYKGDKGDKGDNDKPKGPLRRWGIMILDPQGLDSNNNKYSIIKIYDKWLSKRIPSVGFGGFQIPKKPSSEPGHKRTGSDESVSTTLSSFGSGPNIKVEISNLVFIGGLHNAELISHLLHRRGQSVEQVTKACIFLNADDPYDANDVTKSIYGKCGINYLNSTKPRDEIIEGKKVNGDPYIIKRVSSGNPRYCCQSAFPSIIKFIKDAMIEKTLINVENEKNGNTINENEEDEYKND